MSSPNQIIEEDPRKDFPQAGTRRMLLVSMDISDDEVTSIVCDDRAGLYRTAALEFRRKNGPARRDGPDGRVFMPEAVGWKLTMRKVGPENKWPPVVNRDPDRAPNWNVFGGWSVVDQGSDYHYDEFVHRLGNPQLPRRPPSDRRRHSAALSELPRGPGFPTDHAAKPRLNSHRPALRESG
ncbi:hypothetical protein [Gordonia paraffinivorans]|uniref:hypothetical protein n=1 Tax=Gordonia paraffinivorans TaxID=175628 RepID=UPI001C92D60B|nr:hypothetical protein [Gordonia paraffinivorans]